MKTHRAQLYRSCREEFRTLKNKGCKLYFPANQTISPKKMAGRIARDEIATYMRDEHYDKDGDLIGIIFQRVEL